MASLTPSLDPPEPDDVPFFAARLPVDQQRVGLAVLLTGRPDPWAPAVDQFLEYATENHLDLRELWGGYERRDLPRGTRASRGAGQGSGTPRLPRASRLRAAALLVPSAGRAAMIFLSPPDADPDPATRTARLAHVTRAIVGGVDPGRLRLIQALLDPGPDARADALRRAGFAELADLSYLRRASTQPGKPLDLSDAGLSARPWSEVGPEATRPLFERAILESYTDTLDCPGLIGLRSIEDVIAGHRATGEFDPALWRVLLDGDGVPAGVLLLAGVPSRSTMELVYLGLAPAWRGRGLGRRLVRHTLGLAGEGGYRAVMLAVDDANAPALRVYRSLGFSVAARKRALTWSVGGGQDGA